MKLKDIEKLTEEILYELQGRSGFDGWWWNIEKEIRTEIHEAITKIILEKLNPS